MAKKDRTKEGRSESTKKHVLSIQAKEFFFKKIIINNWGGGGGGGVKKYNF